MSRQRLDAEQIAHLLAIASSRRDATTESERIEAANTLLHEYQLQIVEYKESGDAIDPLLMQGFQELGLKIFAQPDPVLALARLLGRKQRPGKRATNTARDRDIRRAVVDKMNGGMTLENSVADVASDYGLSEDRVRTIYLSGHIEAKASQHQI